MNKRVFLFANIYNLSIRGKQSLLFKADVVVNSIELGNYNLGKIAKSFWDAGGQVYKDDCNKNLANLTENDIGITDGSHFKCQKIYHIPFLSSCKTLRVRFFQSDHSYGLYI